MNTSRGFHTVTIVKKLTVKEADKLYNDFMNYIETTKEIEYFKIGKDKIPEGADEFTKWLYSSFSQYYVMYYPNFKGIIWLLRKSNTSPGFIKPGEIDRPCSIKATINPKILIGENDYLSAATSDYLEEVEALFNTEATKISPILGKYSHYKMSRPDYCVNFDLNELGIDCTAERMIYLIKHGDIPHHYSERVEYNIVSKRNMSDKDSFYLESKSVTINCYRKKAQLENEFPDCPDLEDSHNIIRFEVQCNYLKTYNLLKKVEANSGLSDNSNAIRKMLSEDYCADIIRDYFYRVIRRGDYFTLDGAIKEVKRQRFYQGTKERLINELKRINQCRGIHKVRAALQGKELEYFRQTLRILGDIGVNPVTIPREWNIPRIPNLLDVYDRRIEEAQAEKRREKAIDELLKDYSKEHNKKKLKKH